MIKNIIFDLGLVLLDFNPDNYLKKCNLSDEDIPKYKKMIWGSAEWYQCDRGDFDYEEMIDRICTNNPQYSKKLREILDKNNYDNDSILSEVPGSYEYVESLKKRGYRIFFLSNVDDWILKYDQDTFRVFDLGEGGVYSCEEKCAKPDPKLYQILLDRFRLTPEESVFIDDSPTNVKGAEAVGIKSILHTSIQDTRVQLNAMIAQEKDQWPEFE